MSPRYFPRGGIVDNPLICLVVLDDESDGSRH